MTGTLTGLRSVRFRKVHGAGNDFILITDPPADRDWALSARLLCPRRTGIGADGLVVSRRVGTGPPQYLVRCFNADGSEATMCGNALRCAASCAERDFGDSEMSMTMAGRAHRAVVDASGVAVTAEAGPVSLGKAEITWNGASVIFDAVHTGTEHVVAMAADVDGIDVEGCGRLVRYHRCLEPEGANVNFVQVMDQSQVKIRTYERGVEAETLSCGSGAVAAVAVARRRNMIGEGAIIVHNQASAPLTVTPDGASGVFWVSGPVVVICQGELL